MNQRTSINLNKLGTPGRDAYFDKVVKGIISDRMNANKGKVAGGEAANMSNPRYNQQMLDLCSRIPTKANEQDYNEEIAKFAKRIVSGGEAGVPSELTRMITPLKEELATAASLVETDAATTHVKKVRMAAAESAMVHIVKSELAATLSSFMRTNPMGMMAGGEAGYSLATMRPFQLLETAIQYKNTVKVVYNKLIDTEVFTDRINVQYLRQKWFIVYKDADGKEVKRNIVDHYNNMENVKELRSLMKNAKTVEIPVAAGVKGEGFADGQFNLVAMGIYAANENLAPQAKVVAAYLNEGGAQGEKVDIKSMNMNSAPDAHIMNDGKISIRFGYVKDGENKSAAIHGEINFNDLEGSILASPDIYSVVVEFTASNEMYQRSYTIDTITEKENFQIDYTERIDFSYNPRVNQIFNAALGSDVMAQLIAKGSENVSHSKEQCVFDLFDETSTNLSNGLKDVSEQEAKSVLYVEEDIEATYYAGVPMNDTIKTKITNGLNNIYQTLTAKVNPNGGIGFGALIAPQLVSYLTAVTPVIAKEAIDTTIPGTFAGSPIDSPVLSFSLDTNGMGGLRGIAVKSDKLTGTDITLIPQIPDPNMKNFVLAEQPVLIYSNNEIRNRENLVAPNIHLEAPFSAWAVTPSMAKATISKIGVQEIMPVRTVGNDVVIP